MMTIEQTDKIDGIGIDRNKNELVMLISDHLSWSDVSTHTASLEEKIGEYLNYLNSGQHLETIPQARGLPVRIRLVHQHEPTASAHPVLQAVQRQLEAMNILFSYETLPADY